MLHAICGMFRWEKPYDGSLVFPGSVARSNAASAVA